MGRCITHTAAHTRSLHLLMALFYNTNPMQQLHATTNPPTVIASAVKPSTNMRMHPHTLPPFLPQLLTRYQTPGDEYIDRDEFAAGIAQLGLSYASSSLDLTEAQQSELLNALFQVGVIVRTSQPIHAFIPYLNLYAIRIEAWDVD